MARRAYTLDGSGDDLDRVRRKRGDLCKKVGARNDSVKSLF